jgi:hypothetical protein
MHAPHERNRRLSPLTAVAALCLALLCATPKSSVSAQGALPAEFKVAFIGDQGLGANAVAVLNLIKAEGAQAVMHSGDIDYADNPGAWETQINGVLGADFPYFVSIGNHDELAWAAPNGYQHYLESRFNRLGISWSGRLGVRSSFHYKGVFFVLTAPGITSGFDDGASDLYVRDQLAADHSVWSVCSWHKNMRLMQVGTKADETGWGVYEEARKGGAIIATAHEHSYSRTHLLSSMTNQTVASTSNTLTLTRGNSFAFVSGLGGNSVRTQSLGGNWWASVYAATCLAGDAVCQPNASPGALFAVFNAGGRADKAVFYFKDINGKVVDSFVVISNVESVVETPSVRALTPASAIAGGGGFTLTVDGAGFVNGSVIQWDGVGRPTTFVSSTRLTAGINASDIAATGAHQITVANPGPGGAVSNAVALNVNNPLPSVEAIAPASAFAGGEALTLTVNGAGFNAGSVVRLAGSDERATGFVSPTQLTVTLTRADIAAPGSFNVNVVNPAPGGGASNAKTFQVNAPPPRLLTEEGTGRAIALDSVTWTREPFTVTTPYNFGADAHTRVMLFAADVDPASAGSVSAVTAQAEDAQNRVYTLAVEYVGAVPGFDWLTQIIVRLPDELVNAGEVRVSINMRGAASNKAPLGIKPPAGGTP